MKILNSTEAAYEEYSDCKLVRYILDKNKFKMETNVGRLQIAIKVVWGKGNSVLEFIGKYNVLQGLGQKVGLAKNPVKALCYVKFFRLLKA